LRGINLYPNAGPDLNIVSRCTMPAVSALLAATT
jgi:hypothetical protein